MVLAGALVVLMLFVLNTGAPAKSKRFIKISMVSYKYVPDVITMNAGDTVVLQLQNDDPQRNHSIASPYFSTVSFTVRGDAQQRVAPSGFKVVQLEPGKKAEVEFVAAGHGQFTFLCEVFIHASLGQTGAFIVWPAGYNPKP